jgi:antirestriction protein ArdC
MQQSTLYQQVTQKIITMLETGVAPWQKPWSPYGLPCNYQSGHIYQGINSLLLNYADYEYPYFLTWNQIKDLNGTVRKGSKSEQIYFFTILYWDQSGTRLSPEQANVLIQAGKEITRKRFLQYFNVFNVAQIEGIQFNFTKPEPHPQDATTRCEQLLAHLPEQPRLKRTQKNRAFYAPTTDVINMPYRRQFASPEEYYCTLFHELIHWTGHPARLNRLEPAQFGSEPYSKEELIAEIGAAFLCAHAGIDRPQVTQNSAAYLQSWIDALKGDTTLILHAAGAAQKAVLWATTGAPCSHPVPEVHA